MDGVLIVDKPAGITSHDVIARVRRIIGERRVGHTGTLDPFATGVLVVLVGRATRLAQFLSGADKEYEALVRLGFATDTGDATGTPVDNELHHRPQSFRTEEIEAAMAGLRGESEQIPPMYSAKKVAGRKLYEMARRGEEVERQPVRITISEFVTLAQNGKAADEEVFDLPVRVVCSAGTYVRTLAEDFGRRLGIGAHLAALRRTRAGEFKICDAVTLDRLAELMQSDSIETVMISGDAAVAHLPAITLSSEEVRRVFHGSDLQLADSEFSVWPDGCAVRMRNENGDLVAVGVYQSERQVIHPSVVIASGSAA